MQSTVFKDYTDNLQKELHRMEGTLCDESYYQDALKLMLDCYARGGRVHVAGVGKPQYLAGYFASLLSSIGYCAYVLDGTEATHGSAGQVAGQDVVVLLSYYGNPPELVHTAQTLANLGIEMIAVTGFDDSVIAKMAKVHLNVFIEKEGDPLGKPPRVSMLSTMICLQNLSVLLQEKRELTQSEYLLWHPSGQLGQRI